MKAGKPLTVREASFISFDGTHRAHRRGHRALHHARVDGSLDGQINIKSEYGSWSVQSASARPRAHLHRRRRARRSSR